MKQTSRLRWKLADAASASDMTFRPPAKDAAESPWLTLAAFHDAELVCDDFRVRNETAKTR